MSHYIKKVYLVLVLLHGPNTQKWFLSFLALGSCQIFIFQYSLIKQNTLTQEPQFLWT